MEKTMGEVSKIAWTDATFNPWWGCTRVSPGCENCYAENFAHRFGTQWGVGADRRFFGDKHWNEPLKWNAQAEKAGVPKRVFCASMADVFEDRRELDGPRERLWKLIEATPSLDWLLLSKRPENMGRMLPKGWLDNPFNNVWLGTTVEDQKRAEDRIEHLIQVPAQVRFLSCEPLLEEVDLDPPRCQHCYDGGEIDLNNDPPWCMQCDSEACYGNWLDACASADQAGINWVIVGSESGPSARPMDLEWARSIVRQCESRGVACFVKQVATTESRLAGDAKGEDMRFWPEDLRVREFPEVAS